MNKIFKVKRNSAGQSVVCSEIATSRSKGRVIASALALAVATAATSAHATVAISDVNGLQDALNDINDGIIESIKYTDKLTTTNSDAIAALQEKVAENQTAADNALAGKLDSSVFFDFQNNNASNIQGVLDKVDTKASQTDFDALKEEVRVVKAAADDAVSVNNEQQGKIAENTAAIATKADKADVDAALATKANQSTVRALAVANTNLAAQIGTNQGNIAKLQTEVANKADTETVLTLLGNQEKNTQETFADVLNQISTKADTETVDTIKRDLSAETNRINDLNTQVANKADKATVDANTATIAENTAAIATKADKADVDAALATKANQSAVRALAVANTNLAAQVGTNQGNIAKLDTAVQANTAAIATKAEKTAVEANTAAIAENTAAIATKADKTAVEANTAAIATKAEQSYVDSKVTTLETGLNTLSSNYQGINSKVDKLDEDLSAGIAGAVALAMMPAPAAGSHYITGGTGFYNGESAVALGFTGTTETGKFTYKLGGSLTSSGSGTFGAGAGYRWR
ncbi:MAG: YadA-like family protein [Moraxella sp.]|nr:YadA-like family protein [Moraxella sp.]